MFLIQCINSGGLPFPPSIRKPNKQTLSALKDDDSNRYNSVEELSLLWK